MSPACKASPLHVLTRITTVVQLHFAEAASLKAWSPSSGMNDLPFWKVLRRLQLTTLPVDFYAAAIDGQVALEPASATHPRGPAWQAVLFSCGFCQPCIITLASLDAHVHCPLHEWPESPVAAARCAKHSAQHSQGTSHMSSRCRRLCPPPTISRGATARGSPHYGGRSLIRRPSASSWCCPS